MRGAGRADELAIGFHIDAAPSAASTRCATGAARARIGSRVFFRRGRLVIVTTALKERDRRRQSNNDPERCEPTEPCKHSVASSA